MNVDMLILDQDSLRVVTSIMHIPCCFMYLVAVGAVIGAVGSTKFEGSFDALS